MVMPPRSLMWKLSQMNMLLFLKARLLRSLARLHSRASFKKAKQGDLFFKLCGAGLARGPYDIISLKFSHEVCYTVPWIFIGQILFLDVVDGHYCKPVDGNHATEDQMWNPALMRWWYCPRCLDVSNLHALPYYVEVWWHKGAGAIGIIHNYNSDLRQHCCQQANLLIIWVVVHLPWHTTPAARAARPGSIMNSSTACYETVVPIT